MATLIPMLTISEFKKLKVPELRRLKSCEIYSDGIYLFTFVNGSVDASGFLRLSTENRCQTANAVSGETLDNILKEGVKV
uniref:Uncharacterized protein n=1 Tax=viral metagenome TaxID=1070528 RepID=A0A6M3L109_9ZZZZ